MRLPYAVAEACRTADGRVRATKLPDIARRLFDGPDEEGDGLSLVLESLEALDKSPGSISVRAHMFARTMRGIWACTNASCDQIDEGRELPAVGKLFGIPVSSCDCGGRVLELLYCFECGDVSFGGFISSDEEGTHLLTSSPIDIPASSFAGPEAATPGIARACPNPWPRGRTRALAAPNSSLRSALPPGTHFSAR
jgi:DEAD/DEAH box helicase domain-containing protein